MIASSGEATTTLKSRIESLLPGATSAGLAAAFEARKAAVISSQRQWKIAFYSSLGMLFVAAVSLTIEAAIKPHTLSELAAIALQRVLLIGPVLWLALFSVRQLKTLFRLEEEYAHKVVISTSFEGYKREISSVEKDGPLAKLTEAVIEVLRRSPVRLYDGRTSSDSPIETVTEHGERTLTALGKFLEQIGKLKPL